VLCIGACCKSHAQCFLGVQRDGNHEAPYSKPDLRVVTAGSLGTASYDPDLFSDVHFVKIGMPAQLFFLNFRNKFLAVRSRGSPVV